MLTASNLYSLAKSRYDEAKTLLQNGHPDGAVYLCGYSLEFILKQRITKLLGWESYPPEGIENTVTLKTHKLDDLLKLSGLDKKVQDDIDIAAHWQTASVWKSEMRYRDINSLSSAEAEKIMESTRQVINFILKTIR